MASIGAGVAAAGAATAGAACAVVVTAGASPSSAFSLASAAKGPAVSITVGGGVDAAAGAALQPGCRDRYGHVCFKGGCVVGGCARSPLWRFEKISDARKSVDGRRR